MISIPANWKAETENEELEKTGGEERLKSSSVKKALQSLIANTYLLNNEQLNSGLLSKIHYYLLVAAFQTDVQNAVPKWVRVDEIF